MKEIVVMWVFEEDSYQNVLDLRKRYFNVASDHHPHITFAHYLSIDEDELIKHIDTFIQSISPFEVTFDKVMLLNQYVVITTPFDFELKRYYALFHKKFSPLLNVYTQRENFIPHTTIIAGEHNIKALEQDFKPVRLKIDKCEVSWIKTDGFEIIKTYRLKKVG